MSTNFPTGLDTFVNPVSTTPLNSTTIPHHQQHDNLNDAMTQVEKIMVGPTWFNVMGYGALGDGSTDDTAAFNAAIAAAVTAGGGLVYVPKPASSYLLSGAVSFGAGTNITLALAPGVSFTGSGSLPAATTTNGYVGLGTTLATQPPGINANGLTYTISAGPGNGSGNGGTLLLNGGTSGGSGTGGPVTINGGSPHTSNGTGGGVNINGGAGDGTGGAGTINVQAGNSGILGSQNGGDVIITSGVPGNTGSRGQTIFNRVSLTTLICGSGVTQLSTGNQSYSAGRLLFGFIEHQANGASNGTLDTPANLDAALHGTITPGDSFQCVLANTGSNTITIVGNGCTLIGNTSVTTGMVVTLYLRRIGTATWTVYIR